MLDAATNTEKYEAYKAMKTNLTKAMKAGFYYQAIFIEYAIIEDRTLSALKHVGVRHTDNRGWELKLSVKLNKMRSNSAFANPYVRNRITLELIENVENWKRDRDRLIHALARIPYDSEEVKEIAVRGQDLVTKLDNSVRSVNRYYDKQSLNSREKIVEEY